MNHYALIPLSAFMVQLYNWTYIYAIKRKNPINRAYLILVSTLMGWSITSFIAWSTTNDLFLYTIFKISSVIWLFTGFAFINFTYSLIQRKKDYIYYTFFIFYIVSQVINFSTNLFINGYTKTYWGAKDSSGILYVPIEVAVVLLPFIYSIFI